MTASMQSGAVWASIGLAVRGLFERQSLKAVIENLQKAVLFRDIAKATAVLPHNVKAELRSESQQKTNDGENNVEVKSS